MSKYLKRKSERDLQNEELNLGLSKDNNLSLPHIKHTHIEYHSNIHTVPHN